MAENTWTGVALGAALVANKNMISIFNASASTRFIRVYRAFAFNNQVVAVTGVLNTLRINILSAGGQGGTVITPQAYDLRDSELSDSTFLQTNAVATIGSTIRQLLVSNDEPVIGSVTSWDNMCTLVPYAELWSAGLFDSVIQPITLAAGEDRGFSVQNVTQTVGTGDYELTFTDAAT